jgi:PglZ domain
MQAKATSSACSDKQAHLAHRLHEAVPHGAKLALCFDPEGDLTALHDINDAAGRIWRIVTYQEDDLAFRLAMRALEAEGWSADSPVLIRVAMPDLVPMTHRIDLSFLGDILQRVEGEPVDLRTDAVVTFHTEPVVWPEHLQTHAARISHDLKGFIDGYWRMRKAIGPDRPLGRHHIEVALLLARYQELDYRDLELPQAYPAEIVARFLSLVAEHEFDPEDGQLFWDVLMGSGYLSQRHLFSPWMKFPMGESLLLLTFTDFFEGQGVQNVALSLSGLGLFSQSVHDLLPLLPEVRAFLKAQPERWRRIIQRADRKCAQDQAEQAILLLKGVVPAERWISLIDAETPPTLAMALLLGYLDDRLERESIPILEMPARVPDWAEAWLNGWEVPHHDAPAEARAATMLRMLSRLATIQRRLVAPLPQPDDIGALVDAYVESGDACVELLLALARKDADVIGDEARLARLQAAFDTFQRLILDRLEALDRLAGDMVQHDVRSYLTHRRSTIHFLRPIAAKVGHGGRRLFVWLFDGMRYDTWTEVVRPLLAQTFAIKEEVPLLAPLPTYTQLARKSLFAGGYPDTAWKGFGGRFTPDEQILAARNFGLTSDREMNQETIFIDHADTDVGLEKLRRLKARRFNCLVFNISDDNLHNEKGDLREINDKIRHKVERDVLPEMKRLVAGGDVVVVTSDHGFVELEDQRGIPIDSGQAETQVFYRYLYDIEHPAGIIVPYSGKKGESSVTVLVGRAWFTREKGRYTRYAHGGASLPEIVVPGVVLRKLEAPEAIRLVITAPERLRIQEDDDVDVQVSIRNGGTGRVAIRVTMGQAPAQTAELTRGAERSFTERLRGDLGLKFIVLIVEARGTDGRYAVVKGGSRQIPITVRERTDKVEFSRALDAFSNIE